MSEIEHLDISFPSTVDEIRFYAADTQSQLMNLSREYSETLLLTKNDTLDLELEYIITSIQALEDNLYSKKHGILDSLLHLNNDKRMKNHYRDLFDRLSKLKVNLQLQQVGFLKEINILNRMLEELKNCNKQFIQLINIAEEKREEHSSDSEFLQALEKRIEDIRLSQLITKQTIAQTLLLLQNSTVFEDRLKNTILITIPLWQNQIAFLFGLERVKQYSEEQDYIKEAISTGTKIAESERYERIKEIDIKLSEELLNLKALYQNEINQKQILKEKFLN